MANAIVQSVVQIMDGNGNPVPGAKAYFYDSGTTTPRTVYTDASASTPHATPVVADADGILPRIYATAAVKMDVTTAAGAAVSGYPVDPASQILAASSAAANVSYSPHPNLAETNVQDALDGLADRAIEAGDGITITSPDWSAGNPTIGLNSGVFSTTGYTYLAGSGTYTPTSGTKAIRVIMCGGGGGGGGADGQGASTAAAGGCGAGGESVMLFITNMAQTFTYSVGAGGAGGAAGLNDGATGGTTTFTGSVSGAFTAVGGSGGTSDNGTSATGAQNLGDSSAGGTGGTGTATRRLAGGASLAGIESSGAVRHPPMSGCAALFGSTGTFNPSNGDGAVGRNFGEGGTGGRAVNTATNYAGGNGAAGTILIEELG